MIPLRRGQLPSQVHTLLNRRTANVHAGGATSAAARAEWRRAEAAKRHVKAHLQVMAHGAQRCMYCEDSLGTDIDHFQPITDAPERAFDWLNHLLACSHCNSNQKRDQYPCDAATGACLLVDPTVEDPAAHLRLLPASGVYKGLTAKGRTTVEVFGLNRPDLVMGRQDAFVTACSLLRDWRQQTGAEADAIARALRRSPFAAVLRTLERLREPVARAVMGPEAAAALGVWAAQVR